MISIITQGNKANMAKTTKQFSRYIENEIWQYPGKYQGKKLKDLPLNYLKWGFDTYRVNSPQHTIVQMELCRRLDI